MSDVVLYDVSDGIATITLNRPEKLNSWTAELGHHFWTYLDAAAADGAVKVIVITGAGRGFCSGADMDMLQGIGSRGGVEAGTKLRDEHQTYTLSIPKPVIAAINGSCAGLGMVQASMADIRFAVGGAKFTTAFARRGLIAEHGIGWVLPRLVGPSNALDLLMSGRVILTEEAHRMGFVNFVSTADSLMDDVRAYAKELVERVSPSSMAVMKRQVWHGLQQVMAESNEMADGAMKHSLKQNDFKEGVSSFLENRLPNFAPLAQ